MEPESQNEESAPLSHPPPPPTIFKSKLLFKSKEDYYQQQVRNELMKRMRRLNGIRNKTMQEIGRANNAIVLGRITKMKRNELEAWEKYIDELTAKEKRVTEELEKYEKTEQELYMCCSDEIREYFLEMGSKLKEAIPSSRLEDIYSALIMSAYSLLSEVYDDMLTILHLEDKAFDLYIQITSGDIMHNDENLSSQIRRFLFGLNDTEFHGGKKKKVRKTRRKSRARKTRSRKAGTKRNYFLSGGKSKTTLFSNLSKSS